MPEGQEPDTKEMPASQLDIVDVHGQLTALNFVLTGLLITLRNKGTIDSAEIDAILETSSVKLADKCGEMAKDAPHFADRAVRMKAIGEVVLTIMRHFVATSPQT